MSGRPGYLLLLIFGALLVRVAAGGRLVAYVRPANRPYVLAAGAVVAVLGVMLWLAPRQLVHRPSRLGGLLLVPIIALVFVAPPTQGALVGHRRTGAPGRSAGIAAALRGPEPIALRLAEVVQRASWAPASLHAHVLRVIGFVSSQQPGVIMLGRLSITCCAADAQEDDIEVRVGTRTNGDYARGQWLTVTGRYAGLAPGQRFVPVLAATSVAATDAPANPYG